MDVDDLIHACQVAAAEPESILAVRDVLEEAMADRAALAAALPATEAELTTLYSSAEVTIMKIVWGPGMTIPPHDHRMWACNGIYIGREQNQLFRRFDRSIVESGGLDIGEGEVGLLGVDAIHSVTNPRTHELTAAIHVYGGDFMNIERSTWTGDPLVEDVTNTAATRALFEEAKRAR